ncbi:MAG: alpha/beta hydrolase [Acidimicrobiia bacterium]|nr:alpha/beta hydrolase [Acidimicrobiia bacterium]
MANRAFPAVALAAAVIGGRATGRRYRRDLHRAEERLSSLDRSVIANRFGRTEFAAIGSGDPLLVSHGIFHGFDGALTSVEHLADGRRVIAPSRFGYLGSTMPPRATVAGQAEAFALLLDHLELDAVDMIAVSAGTGAAIQFALRHPDRVKHLIVSSGNFPGSETAQAPPNWAKVFYSDPAMWLLKSIAPAVFAGLMGVPDGFPRNDDDSRQIDRMLDSIFPVGPRVTGAVFDAYVSNPEVGAYPLEQIRVPTLIVHAKDDPLASFDAAAAAADRIPGADLLTLDSGGHLQLGQAERVQMEIAAFLAPVAARQWR